MTYTVEEDRMRVIKGPLMNVYGLPCEKIIKFDNMPALRIGKYFEQV